MLVTKVLPEYQNRKVEEVGIAVIVAAAAVGNVRTGFGSVSLLVASGVAEVKMTGTVVRLVVDNIMISLVGTG